VGGTCRRESTSSRWRAVSDCDWFNALAEALPDSVISMILQLVKWVICLLLGVSLLFYILTRITKWKNRLTGEQVGKIIEKHLNQNEGPWDWDDFTSLPIHDDYLDRIRLRCIELDSVPSFDRIPELKRILDELRQRQSGNPQ
jgi:hypothetical protein